MFFVQTGLMELNLNVKRESGKQNIITIKRNDKPVGEVYIRQRRMYFTKKGSFVRESVVPNPKLDFLEKTVVRPLTFSKGGRRVKSSLADPILELNSDNTGK